ncbi:hypothetical protein GCM10007913_08120 [Devosia yakushimensis]|uniref:DUF3828 domain-containing protein n=1 Tax=Devosia yakushimensis TaxID=470028 RepID=A0ABQ5U9R2_9HYPH|nr:DUF3828 domain-containing protein [Devosia yakushimensis]GLQ08880.1 hypothetical protein GCM10007913_08120 [Devosia yakushimensis]
MRLVPLAASLFLALGSLAAAQTYDTPQDLLEAFYEPYFSGEFYEDESSFRSSALQALYDADAASTPAGEMGALSFDPYIDGQDFDLTDLTFSEPQIDGDTAIVDVNFRNFDQPQHLVYDLVFENGGWRIDDVVSTNPENQYRLSEIFTEAASIAN